MIISKNIFSIIRVVNLKTHILFIGSLFISNLLEMIGLISTIPLLATILSNSTGEPGTGKRPSMLYLMVKDMFEQVGLEFSILNISIILFSAFVLKSLINISVMSYIGISIAQITTAMRITLIRSMLSAKWSYFVKQPLGRLINATGVETSVIGDAYLSIASMMANILQLIMYVLLALLISWQFSLLIICGVIIMVLPFVFLTRRVQISGQEYMENINSLANNFTDTIISIKTLKAMGRNAHFAQLFQRDAEGITHSMKQKIFSQEFASEVIDPLIVIIFIFGFLIGVGSGQVTLHELILIGVLFARSLIVVHKSQKLFLRIKSWEPVYGNIVDVLEDADRHYEKLPTGKKVKISGKCNLENISFNYNEDAILKDVSIEVKVGEVTCVTGGSGSGKTTMIDLLLLLHEPSSGRILIDGTDLLQMDVDAWRRSIGYVSQEVILFHDTIMMNVTLGDESLTEEDVVWALKAAGVWDAVEGFAGGINEVVGERGTRLSGGQRQRIAIARAIVNRPQLLILDEATSALDPDTERAISENLISFVHENNVGVLVVSHNQIWAELADAVYKLRQGAIQKVR